MNMEHWEAFKKACNRAYRNQVDESLIGTRGRMSDHINDVAEHGRVVVHIWQMDCDCASWDSFQNLPAHVRCVNDYIDRAYYAAEGQMRVSVIRPSEEPEPEDIPRSRDHAMEAFENGHPYSIQLGDM